MSLERGFVQSCYDNTSEWEIAALIEEQKHNEQTIEKTLEEIQTSAATLLASQHADIRALNEHAIRVCLQIIRTLRANISMRHQEVRLLAQYGTVCLSEVLRLDEHTLPREEVAERIRSRSSALQVSLENELGQSIHALTPEYSTVITLMMESHEMFGLWLEMMDQSE